MTIDDLINDIENMDSTEKTELDELKVIIGQNGFNGFCDDERYALTSPIDIYKTFKEVAFIEEKFNLAASEIFVVGLLFGNLNIAAKFIDCAKKKGLHYSKFVEFLYYKHHIVLVNRKSKAIRFKVFDTKFVTDVLNVGGTLCDSVIKHLSKKNKKVRMGQCLHCSPKVMNTDRYFRLWFLNDDSSINSIGKFLKTSFNEFRVFVID